MWSPIYTRIHKTTIEHTSNKHKLLYPQLAVYRKQKKALSSTPQASASVLAAQIVQAVILGSWSTSSKRSTPGKKSSKYHYVVIVELSLFLHFSLNQSLYLFFPRLRPT